MQSKMIDFSSNNTCQITILSKTIIKITGRCTFLTTVFKNNF